MGGRPQVDDDAPQLSRHYVVVLSRPPDDDV